MWLPTGPPGRSRRNCRLPAAAANPTPSSGRPNHRVEHQDVRSRREVRRELAGPPAARSSQRPARSPAAGKGLRNRPAGRIIALLWAWCCRLDGRWPMVGRVEVWRQLRDALAGDVRVILIHGAAGVGKTRLAAEILLQAKQEGRARLPVTATA